jgi:hypothetical protein
MVYMKHKVKTEFPLDLVYYLYFAKEFENMLRHISGASHFAAPVPISFCHGI